MSSLPTSFVFVLIFVAVAGTLIIYFTANAFLFRRYLRKAEQALQRQHYAVAVEYFCRAETRWDLNVSRQTTKSYQKDFAMLESLLIGLETAARASNVELPIREYRDAVKAVQAQFPGSGVEPAATSSSSYASAFTRLSEAQTALRKQSQNAHLSGPV